MKFSLGNSVRAFTILCLFSILFWWTPLVATFRLALVNAAYTHILLILPLSASLIYFNSKFRNSQSLWVPQPSPGLGVPLLVLSLLLACGARWGLAGGSESSQLSLSMLSLVIWWIGSFLLCVGVGIFRSLLFPLFLLFLVVPLPQFALDWVIEFLQYQSAVAARLLFHLARVPATQDGIMLSIPGLDIEVSNECSSIRSSMMLLVTTMVLSSLFLHSWWRKALLVATAVPLSIAKNGLRIFTIGELGTRVDPGFLTGRLHHQGGIVFFGVAVVLMSMLLLALRRSEFASYWNRVSVSGIA